MTQYLRLDTGLFWTIVPRCVCSRFRQYMRVYVNKAFVFFPLSLSFFRNLMKLQDFISDQSCLGARRDYGNEAGGIGGGGWG